MLRRVGVFFGDGQKVLLGLGVVLRHVGQLVHDQLVARRGVGVEPFAQFGVVRQDVVRRNLVEHLVLFVLGTNVAPHVLGTSLQVLHQGGGGHLAVLVAHQVDGGFFAPTEPLLALLDNTLGRLALVVHVHHVARCTFDGVDARVQPVVSSLCHGARHSERAATNGPAGETVDVVHQVAGGVAVWVEFASGELRAHVLQGLRAALQPHTQRGFGAGTHSTLAGCAAPGASQPRELAPDQARQSGVGDGGQTAVATGHVAQRLRRRAVHQRLVLLSFADELTSQLVLAHHVRDAQGSALGCIAEALGYRVRDGASDTSDCCQSGRYGHWVHHGRHTLAHLTAGKTQRVADAIDLFNAADLRGVHLLALRQAVDLAAQLKAFAFVAGNAGIQLLGAQRVEFVTNAPSLKAAAQAAHAVGQVLVFDLVSGRVCCGDADEVAESCHV